VDRDEYLSITHERLERLIADPVFRNNLAQMRARAIQEELLTELPDVDFTFVPQQIWRYCDFIFSESSLLLRENHEGRDTILGWTRYPARAFEFLARLAKEDEKEIFLLNSAMCYHIAGYQANAQCIAKLVEEEYLIGGQRAAGWDSSDSVLVSLFRHALVAFLQRDIAKLLGITTEAIHSIHDFQEAVVGSVAYGIAPVAEIFALTAHAYLQQALADLVQYCLYGDRERLTVAKDRIGKSYKYFVRASDATLGAITSELRAVLDLFDERSTWSTISEHAANLLRKRVWRVYLRNLAYEKSIVEFWLSQLKAIRSGLLTSEDSYVLQMPTSAGKTLIAELAILAALTQDEHARCLYVAPYRALANEIESSLAGTLGAVGYRVSSLSGGFEFDAFQDFLLTEADVLVATPEKIDLFLRTHPEYFENLSVIVVDEGHILDEGIPVPEDSDIALPAELEQMGTLGRGPLLEFLLTRLKRRLADARFIFLSAVMPEVSARDLAEWLSKEKQVPLRVDSQERPSRQVIAKFQWRSSQNGELEYIGLAELPGGRHPWVPSFIRRKQYFTGELTSSGRRQKRSWPRTDSKVQSTAMLAVQFARADPVLVFCAQKRDVRSVIENILTSLKYLEASDVLPTDKLRYVETPDLESYQLAVDWLGEEHPLTRALHHSVALHYGPLPDPVRQAVEDEFREGSIRILVSTSTLGQGVNMPIKTAIIYSLERVWPEQDENGNQQVHRQKIRKRDFWNICGRAGRAGKETEGQVIFVVISQTDSALLEEFMDQTKLEEVNSALFALLQALVDNRISDSDLIGYLDSHILAIIAEEVVDTQDEVALREFLGTSLVGVQALRRGVDLHPLILAIKNASAWVLSQVPDAALRHVFSATGLRLQSCQSLEKSAELFLKGVDEDMLKAEQDRIHYNHNLLHAAFRACEGLPEMRLGRRIEYHGPESELQIVSGWIEGSPVSELRAGSWVSAESESFGQYIADRVTYKLPWGFNGFLRIVAHKLNRKYEDLPRAWQHLPSMMKFGVDNLYACWASSLGISSRQMVLQVAERYQPEESASFENFVKWVMNLSTEFVLAELDASDFEKKRLLKTIAQIIPDNELLDFTRSGKLVLQSLVQGIQYEGRHIVATQVSVGDPLALEAEPDNPYDPYLVRILFRGAPIGYVQRYRAKTISREILLGRDVRAYARTVRPATDEYPFPRIEVAVELG
jgi:helicase